MAPERVTITVSSSAGGNAPLTVEDAMRQILDFFELLNAAGGEDKAKVNWRLVNISMNSPLRATAEAFSTIPGVAVELIARREKEVLSHTISELEQRRVPDWMDKGTRERAKALLVRNTDGIARTDVEFFDGENVVSIVPRLARQAVAEIEDFERKIAESEEDLSRTEVGSFEANVIGLTTHFRKPAVEVRERRGKGSVKCPMSDDLAARIGREHRWAEVWGNQRVLISGRITFRKDGLVESAEVFDITSLNVPNLRLDEIADPNFTGGLDPVTYVNSLWSSEVG